MWEAKDYVCGYAATTKLRQKKWEAKPQSRVLVREEPMAGRSNGRQQASNRAGNRLRDEEVRRDRTQEETAGATGGYRPAAEPRTW